MRLRRKPKNRFVVIDERRFISHGLTHHFWDDIYHSALTVRWPMFFAMAAAAFVVLNAMFAGLYLLGDHAIANQQTEGYAGAFFFSVETLSTVGYGDKHPQTLYAHILATVEIFTGMGCIALVTGLIFSRFSRPRARILFADHPVVRTIDGVSTLMVRAANARLNVITAASAQLYLLRNQISPEGFNLRKIIDLRLIRNRHPNFMLSWTLMHVIDESSPLYGETAESLAATSAWFTLSIEGVDETTAQSMHARRQWTWKDLRWQHRYQDLIHARDDGTFNIDYTLFQDVVMLDESSPPAP